MYESPFDMVMTPLGITYEEVKKDIDGQIIESVMKATQAVNVTVDKEELLRALRYDRGQYDKGYADAKAEIVHCKDCKRFERWNSKCGYCDKLKKRDIPEDFYCGYAERRKDGQSC